MFVLEKERVINEKLLSEGEERISRIAKTKGWREDYDHGCYYYVRRAKNSTLVYGLRSRVVNLCLQLRFDYLPFMYFGYLLFMYFGYLLFMLVTFCFCTLVTLCFCFHQRLFILVGALGAAMTPMVLDLVDFKPTHNVALQNGVWPNMYWNWTLYLLSLEFMLSLEVSSNSYKGRNSMDLIEFHKPTVMLSESVFSFLLYCGNSLLLKLECKSNWIYIDDGFGK